MSTGNWPGLVTDVLADFAKEEGGIEKWIGLDLVSRICEKHQRLRVYSRILQVKICFCWIQKQGVIRVKFVCPDVSFGRIPAASTC